MTTPIAAATETHDLHSYLEQYEREHPDEIVHVERPIDAAWELTALTMHLEKAKRFPILICHNVIADGQRLEMPLVLGLMASRERLARALVAKSVVKYAIVVDEDIDVYGEREVMMAFATRFRAQHGLIRLDGMPDPPADPASSNGMITKVAFDCTKPLGEDFPDRLSIPQDVLARIDPAEILGRERLERIPIEMWG